MEKSRVKRIHHKGRLTQIPIYLGKFFRMFIYEDDWKVVPMAGVIAALVAFVVGSNMFKTMEGTTMGSLGITCICIWNGFFNSIQSICRERSIVKREHRSGMHITSYLLAHVIYQAFICVLQSAVTVAVCVVAKMSMPVIGFITPWFYLDMAITVFLITFAADMMSLTVSSFAKTTTAAMTIMPFMLIFELLFSGRMFQLSGFAETLTNLSLAKWGLNCLCTQASYNDLPMVTVWNQMVKFKNVSIMGETPIEDVVLYMQDNNLVSDFNLAVGHNSMIDELNMTAKNIFNSWINLGLFACIFIVLTFFFLKRIDRDKR
ncbi:MAG: ABC transporter permease [Lachnospiraceae bacterium]|nr:ABC transporter permease [Lachnospiraceae bacterium]